MNTLHRYIPELTRERWKHVVVWTAAIAVVTCCVALLATALAKSLTGDSLGMIDVLIAIGTSIVLALPVIGTLSIKIQELALANETIRLYATTDPMTGLLNRDTFTQLVEAHLGPMDNGRPPVPGCLLAIDVDHFKQVNDTFGHHVGDEALRAISTAVRQSLREYDLCGRMGGEEFGAYLVGASLNESLGVADRIRVAVNNIRFAPKGNGHPLSVSIGITVGPWRGDFTELYKASDRLLYLAKHNGRNRVEAPPNMPETLEADHLPDVPAAGGQLA